MRKSLLLAAAASFISSAAFADTVAVTSVTDLTVPSAKISSTGVVPFVGTKNIVLTLGSKTCTWVGSASGSVPLGCNYGITVNNSTGQLSSPTSLDNPVCTPTSQMLAACK